LLESDLDSNSTMNYGGKQMQSTGPSEQRSYETVATPDAGVSVNSGGLGRFLKCHPFPVLAYFERVVAVSFAFPEAVLRPLVARGLEVDTHEGLGFVTVAMVWTKRLRPAGFPRFLGRDFFLAGYRIFVRFEEASGRRLRGLQILQSETDKHSMVRLGNLMTGYHYQHVAVQITDRDRETEVKTATASGEPKLDLTFALPASEVGLPEGSPFKDWRSARRFAGPMPFTFSPQANGSFVIVEGRRQDWEPHPVVVKHWQVSLFSSPAFRGVTPVLANAFTVKNIPYRWEKGRVAWPGGIRE